MNLSTRAETRTFSAGEEEEAAKLDARGEDGEQEAQLPPEPAAFPVPPFFPFFRLPTPALFVCIPAQ